MEGYTGCTEWRGTQGVLSEGYTGCTEWRGTPCALSEVACSVVAECTVV